MTDVAAGTDGTSGESREALSPSSRRVIQTIYDLLRARSAWPTFRTVDLHFDRRLGIADAQAALAAVPAGYLQRSWHSFGFYDNDEVRLSLRGIFECVGGPDDLELLKRFTLWLSEDADRVPLRMVADASFGQVTLNMTGRDLDTRACSATPQAPAPSCAAATPCLTFQLWGNSVAGRL